MSRILRSCRFLQRVRIALGAAALLAAASPCAGFSLPANRSAQARAVIDSLVAGDYDGSLLLCDSMIRADAADPLGWMLKLSAIGLHDLDLDSATESLDFGGVFRKTSNVIYKYERTHGVSSYSRTIKGFARGMSAAYSLWRKRYLAGLDLGFGAMDDLHEAKKLDNSNFDVDFFLGFYTYVRADLKKNFGWAFFWYAGDKVEGIRAIRLCSRSAQFCRRAASLLLSEVLYREGRFVESDSITADLLRSFPNSRLVRWTCAKRAEAARSWTDAADSYAMLADAYDSLPCARRNSLVTRNKAAHMYFCAGDFGRARIACNKILGRACARGDAFCRQINEDAGKLLAGLPAVR
jgi:hypothetical protein